MLDERPLHGLLRAIDVDALAILSRHVEKRAIDARAQVGILKFNMRGLDGEGRIVFGDEAGW